MSPFLATVFAQTSGPTPPTASSAAFALPLGLTMNVVYPGGAEASNSVGVTVDTAVQYGFAIDTGIQYGLTIDTGVQYGLNVGLI